ncbi:putative lysine decarboxylase [bacterium BMS3Abin05]|nr:putative lysine decarboxylase [bacterium BMS3Abin05]GBE28960.1 putative lysine decarboxylase [bacterium BMS3Bbin03]HDL79075.1 TIGR00725 family protein [Bacteroidota bacterium]HDZ13192.1 TIGR00725 family protein [Bacteroidota bacterium]
MKKIVGVIGGASVDAGLYELAREVGRGLAENGLVLVTGGRTGVMEAASRGAKEKGGLVIGILPGDSREQANPYVDIPIVTGLGIARNILIVRTAQVVIAIDGGYGTLSELAFALQLGKPVIGLHTREIDENIHTVETPEKAVQLALKFLEY